jgi:signal transduction histidine kinase
MLPAEAPAEPAAGSSSGHAWNIGLSRWELLYGIIFAAVLAIVAAATVPAAGKAVALGAIGAMAPWYLLVGRPYVRSMAGAVTRRSVTYITGIVVLFAVASVQVPNTLFLCIALLPQCYDFLPERLALIPALSMTAVGAASVGYWDRGPSRIPIAVGLFAAISAFTVAFGGYIGRIITQSGERASLIAQLEATRAELAEVSREAGVMAERQRLAGEIHDTLAQGFSSILMLIQAAETQLDLSPATARHQLGLAAQTARENLAEARTLVGGLASAQLQTGTLEEALRRITERAGAELGIEASFATDGAGRRLPAATEVVLLRTGQEALANVRKHAAAKKVAVRLRYASDSVVLEVIDDGAGFEPALVNGGYGLRGMRTRVDEAGGNITVRSAHAHGTSVRVEVPA